MATPPDGIETYTGPLTQLAKAVKPQNILEIGVGYFGFSTGTWLSNTEAQVTSIDKGDWQGAPARLAEEFPGRLTFILGRTADVLPTLPKQSFDFIYIDGDHSYNGAKADMLGVMPLLAPGGVIALDDYHVETLGGMDVSDTGEVLSGEFGVGRAADEVFTDGWERCYEDLPLANGGVCFRRQDASA